MQIQVRRRSAPGRRKTITRARVTGTWRSSWESLTPNTTRMNVTRAGRESCRPARPATEIILQTGTSRRPRLTDDARPGGTSMKRRIRIIAPPFSSPRAASPRRRTPRPVPGSRASPPGSPRASPRWRARRERDALVTALPATARKSRSLPRRGPTGDPVATTFTPPPGRWVGQRRPFALAAQTASRGWASPSHNAELAGGADGRRGHRGRRTTATLRASCRCAPTAMGWGNIAKASGTTMARW